MPTSLIRRQQRWSSSDHILEGSGYSGSAEDRCEHIENHSVHFAQAFFQVCLCTWMSTCEMPPQMTWHGWVMCGHPGADVQHPRRVQGPSKKCSSCCPFSCSLPWPWCWALAGHHLGAVGSLQQEKVPASQGLTSVTAEEQHTRGQENLKCSTLDCRSMQWIWPYWHWSQQQTSFCFQQVQLLPILPHAQGKACPPWGGQRTALPLLAGCRCELLEIGCQKLKDKVRLEPVSGKKHMLTGLGFFFL